MRGWRAPPGGQFRVAAEPLAHLEYVAFSQGAGAETAYTIELFEVELLGDAAQVVAADRGREFAFVVGGAWVRWGYTFTAADGGTRVTESWEFLPDGITRFHDRFGDDAETQIANRTEAAHRGIPVTLAALKKAAEAG